MRPGARLLVVLLVALCAGAVPAARALAQGAGTAAAAPSETDGQINGKRARLVAQGDDILLSTAEADRIGVAYQSGKRVSIGGTTIWLVTLDSVTVGGRTRLAAPAGVVPDIAAYFAALRGNSVEALTNAHAVQAEVGGQSVQAFDLGMGGVMLPIAEARRIGLKYEAGKRKTVGDVAVWLVEVPVRVDNVDVLPMVLVTEPEPFFKAMQAEIDKKR
ncbi:MAG: hypothetical protein ABI641_05875 [Caldimonas sp.]